MIEGFPVFGEPLMNAVEQMIRVRDSGASAVALMADHHLGYSQPIGGVAVYEDQLSPSGVGYDIACGNKAVRLDAPLPYVNDHIGEIMDSIWETVSFGVGRKNKESVQHPLFDDDPAWDIEFVAGLRDLAASQLGTVGSGNHYVDLFRDEDNRVWVGVHFGSRGLGHKIATEYVKRAGGKDGIDVPPALLREKTADGEEYRLGMELAGRYAYAGRDWVCAKVAELIGAEILEEVHNHHNFAWREVVDGRPQWVVRKGATPAYPGQFGFVGATMSEPSVILEGVDHPEAEESLHSTVHGAGRVMSRTQAAGKVKWVRNPEWVEGCDLPRKIRRRVREGEISTEERLSCVREAGVVLRGGGNDEAPRAYKRLHDVLAAHANTIRVVHHLYPIGVAMAGIDEFDPYKD